MLRPGQCPYCRNPENGECECVRPDTNNVDREEQDEGGEEDDEREGEEEGDQEDDPGMSACQKLLTLYPL